MIAHGKPTGAGDERRLLDLLAQTLEIGSPMRDRIWLTTAELLRSHQHDSPPLAAPIWS